MGYMNDDWNDWGHGAIWYGLVHFLLWALFLGIVLFVATRILRNSNISGKADKESPIEILDRRLANGEVSKDDYIVARELLLERDKKK